MSWSNHISHWYEFVTHSHTHTNHNPESFTCYALMCHLVCTGVSYMSVTNSLRDAICVTNSLVTHWCVSWYLLLCHMFDKLSGMFIYGGSYTLECNLVWVRHTFIWIRVWLIHTHIQMHWSVIDQLTSFQDSSHITRQSTRTPSTQLILFSKLIRFFFTISCEWVYECDIWVGDGQVLSEIISVLHE